MIVCYQDYKLRNSSLGLCYFLHPPVTYTFIGSNNDIIIYDPPLERETKFHTRCGFSGYVVSWELSPYTQAVDYLLAHMKGMLVTCMKLEISLQIIYMYFPPLFRSVYYGFVRLYAWNLSRWDRIWNRRVLWETGKPFHFHLGWTILATTLHENLYPFLRAPRP